MRAVLYPGFDAYPTCRKCGGSGEPYQEAGVVHLRRCNACDGTGYQKPDGIVVKDSNDIYWVLPNTISGDKS